MLVSEKPVNMSPQQIKKELRIIREDIKDTKQLLDGMLGYEADLVRQQTLPLTEAA